MSKIKDVIQIDRDPAFPIYAATYSHKTVYDSKGYFPGRVVMAMYESEGRAAVLPELEEWVDENDIVFIPLYAGNHISGRYIAEGTHQKCEAYAENMAVIKRIGPKVRGILFGNAGPEFTFKHNWLQSGIDNLPRKVMSEMASEFVKETSEFAIDAGAQPFYGIIDWDLAADCYFGDWLIRDTVNDVGGIQITFTGYQLFGIHMHGPGSIVPHPDDFMFFPVCPKIEYMPKPELQEYIRGGEFWTGVNGPKGIENGNDIKLAEYGFKAGVMGWPGTPGL